MLIDYHTHTYLCKHADGKPQEYLEAAERNGLSELGLADHSPWPAGFDPRWRMTIEEYPVYREIVKDLKAQSSKVKVRYGIEIDWVPGKMDEIYNSLQGEELDYIIGSIHYIDDFPFDNPELLPVWKKKETPDLVWNRYAELLVEFINSCNYEIIGHADLPKKFGYYPSSMKKFNSTMHDAFQAAAKKNMAIEINTSGLRKPVKEFYPSLELLKLAKECGLALTLGSDAHSPKDVASDFSAAVELARTAGYNEIAAFERRTLKLHPLG
jgi:histidinol-phosphatase (PHP family)